MAREKPLIQISGLRFGYPGRGLLFNGLDFLLNEGDRVALCGENGAGKSTLFLNMLGLMPFDRGSIRFWGKECTGEEDFVGVRKRAGLLFQDPDDQLFCPTVIEDVAFGLLNKGFSQKQAQERGEAVLEKLGISHLAERVPYKLSGGEKRMASLATVLAMEPEILLLDEPTTGLSDKAREILMEVLDSFNAKGMVLISHDRNFLETVANRMVHLKGGKIYKSN